jgi:hypothetical protein
VSWNGLMDIFDNPRKGLQILLDDDGEFQVIAYHLTQ